MGSLENTELPGSLLRRRADADILSMALVTDQTCPLAIKVSSNRAFDLTDHTLPHKGTIQALFDPASLFFLTSGLHR